MEALQGIAIEAGASAPAAEAPAATVVVVGLGYVGLPTSLALAHAGFGVVGLDVSESRLDHIRAGSVDLLPEDHKRLETALANPHVVLTSNARSLSAADVVLICVPTPVDEDQRPDLTPLRAACASVVSSARAGQIIVLTSTSHVGATRELLVEPLNRRGLVAGRNINVAFSPERIDPGNSEHAQHTVPRVLGGATEACTQAALPVISEITTSVVVVSSPEAAELAKLYENTFRAVNIALANELADVAQAHELDAVEVLDAASTKPYGYMRFHPGPGVGGHCIPCDPHYLLEPLDSLGARAPIVRESMRALHERPDRVVRRAVSLLSADGIEVSEARVLVVGLAYKPGVADLRGSPACEVLRGLHALGAHVQYHDPQVRSFDVDASVSTMSVRAPDPSVYDLVIVAVIHPGEDLTWLDECERVLDCTYRTARGRTRHLI